MNDKPSPFPKIKPYLTIIPGRRPEEKLHTNIGQAKNAVGYHWYGGGGVRGGQIWEWRQVNPGFDWDGHDWFQLYDVPPNTPTSQLPWKKEA